ncbi:ketopantoate reductase family protein [Paenibacillus yanchengensis]|uniref:2-dehydropantoate 2-reductase n=1 Tax=Paenibacillus yanchengensis TaxID=2035833 RepID=A0ABW4YKS0_9BACL
MIEIVGAGSIGLMLAARLAISGTSVHLWTRTAETAEQLTSKGIQFVDIDGVSHLVGVTASSIEEDVPQYITSRTNRWLLLCMKQTDLTTALFYHLQRITQHDRQVTALSMIALQNGFGHLSLLATELPDVAIYAAVLTHGARRTAQTTVLHTGAGEIWISSTAEQAVGTTTSIEMIEQTTKNTIDLQKKVVHMMNKAGLMVKLSNEMYNRLYEKLLINAVINPLTAIYDVSNGELPKHRTRLSLMRQLCEESYAVLQLVGLQPLGVNYYWERILQICEQTATNVSSMLADVRAEKETEIMAINGAIVIIAREQEVQAPLNTAMIELVQVLCLGRRKE